MLLTPHADPKTSECFDNQNQGSTSGQIERIFGLVCHMFSVATTPLCHHGTKAAIDGTETNEQACVPIKLCLHKQAASLQVIVCPLPT